MIEQLLDEYDALWRELDQATGNSKGFGFRPAAPLAKQHEILARLRAKRQEITLVGYNIGQCHRETLDALEELVHIVRDPAHGHIDSLLAMQDAVINLNKHGRFV